MRLRQPLGYFSFPKEDHQYISDLQQLVEKLEKEDAIILASFALDAVREGTSMADELVSHYEAHLTNPYTYFDSALVDLVDSISADGYVQLATAILY